MSGMFYNLPGIIFTTTILIRILVAIPLSIGAMAKFAFFGPILSVILGVASVILLETILTVLSLVNAKFRTEDHQNAMAFIMVLVLLITVYNGYLLQAITDVYNVPHKFAAMLTLHMLNGLSVVLIESMAYIAEPAEEIDSDTADVPAPIKERINELVSLGVVKQADLAKILNVSQSTISRNYKAA